MILFYFFVCSYQFVVVLYFFSSFVTTFNRPFVIWMQQSYRWWHWIDCRKSTKITCTRFVMVSTYYRCFTWIYCLWPQSIRRINIGSVSFCVKYIDFTHALLRQYRIIEYEATTTTPKTDYDYDLMLRLIDINIVSIIPIIALYAIHWFIFIDKFIWSK